MNKTIVDKLEVHVEDMRNGIRDAEREAGWYRERLRVAGIVLIEARAGRTLALADLRDMDIPMDPDDLEGAVYALGSPMIDRRGREHVLDAVVTMSTGIILLAHDAGGGATFMFRECHLTAVV